MRLLLLLLSAVLGIVAVGCSGESSDDTPNDGASDTSIDTVDNKAGDTSGIADGKLYSVAGSDEAELQRDLFTFSNYDKVRVSNVDLDLEVDFDNKILSGTAALDISRIDSDIDEIILDTNELNILAVETLSGANWTAAAFSLGDSDAIKGRALTIQLAADTSRIRVTYETSPGAQGLQWLSPEQTAGKKHPFLFSQFQPLLARSMIPVQDTPAVRITYSAKIKTPPDLIAVMSASQDPDGTRDGEYFFEMPQPIPSYLLAIAVGDFGFKPIGDHMGVYAEAYILDAAAAEFADTPQMEDAIDSFYGPYQWGRYDMIVLPPSFPFGGMENPRLSFLTPTLVAGDKSLTNVVAHELAHSWSGNLVTNSTWRDAWLNEGFTSYVENRTMEALYGAERATMERYLDLQSLKRDVAEAERPALTALKMPADITHPDEAFSQVSYAGGMFFLKFLEERFGREAFDGFLRGYFDHFAFQSLTTEDFLTYFDEELWSSNREAVTSDEINAWVYEPGFPDTIEQPVSNAFEIVAMGQSAWLGGGDLEGLGTNAWTTHEWLHFLNTLPDDLSPENFAMLDNRFGLTLAQNAEIAHAWYMKSIAGGYEPALTGLEAFLLRVGRGKFIYRLYRALEENGQGDWARGVYGQARSGYHPIAQKRIDEILK